MKKSSPPKRRVFLLDDSIYTGVLVRNILAPTEFYFSGQASSLKQALRKFPESRSNIVLLDSTLPDASLNEAIDVLKAINEETKIVVMGPLMHLPLIQEVLGNGADSFLFKPIEARTLLSVLRSFYKAKPSKLSNSKKIALLYTGFFRELQNYLQEEVGVDFQEIILSAAKNSKLAEYVILKTNPIEFLPRPYVKGKKMLNKLHIFYLEVYKEFTRRLGKEAVKGLFIDSYQSFYYEHQHIPMPNNLFPSTDHFFLSFEEPITVRKRRDSYSWSSSEGIEKIIDKPLGTVKKENLRVYLVLSSFDPVLGPKILVSYPTPTGSDKKKIMSDIPENMDLIGVEIEEPFLTFHKNWGVYNIIFSVPSKVSRGGNKDFMLSIAVYPANEEVLTKLPRLSSVIKAVTQEVKQLLINIENEGKEAILDGDLLKFLFDFQIEIEKYFKQQISET